jgi:hypothetical protein
MVSNKIGSEGVDWIQLSQDRAKRQDVVNMVINLPSSSKGKACLY